MLVPKPGKRTAELIWRTTPDAQSVELLRSPGLNGEAQSVVFRGAGSATSYLDTGLRPGREYQYRLGAVDQAANEGTKTLDFVARGALLFPGPGEQVKKPPLLVWSAVRGASYYNVVLVRSHRVYSAWPVRARLQLPRSWKYRGRKFKLRPGTYRWYVWPGRGKLSAGRYGKLLRRQFVRREALGLTLVSDHARGHGEEGRVAQDEERGGRARRGREGDSTRSCPPEQQRARARSPAGSCARALGRRSSRGAWPWVGQVGARAASAVRWWPAVAVAARTSSKR